MCIPKVGYVGVGHVLTEATRFDEAHVRVDEQERKLAELPLEGSYVHQPPLDTDETAEYVVPVEWVATLAKKDAVWQPGMFANQNSACKLRNKFTLDHLTNHLGLSGQSS